MEHNKELWNAIHQQKDLIRELRARIGKAEQDIEDLEQDIEDLKLELWKLKR